MNKFSTILWDFDGVIMDSMEIKRDGFLELFKEHDAVSLNKMELYHFAHGGVSRFDKIRYFYHDILQEEVSEERIASLAVTFADIIAERLHNEQNLIRDSVDFIKRHDRHCNFHIVSGAEHHELIRICERLHLRPYFKSIHGSPTKKADLVAHVLRQYGYKTDETMLIGDAMTDYHAAKENSIAFFGYNNPLLKPYNYINRLEDFSC